MSLLYGQMIARSIEDAEFRLPSVREFTQIDCSNLPDLCRQSERDSCDINLIIKQFDRQQLAALDAMPRRFMDVSEVGTLQEQLSRLAEVGQYFAQLPADVREEFDNSEMVFLEAIGDPDFEKSLAEFGVKVEKKKEEGVTPPPPAQ